MGSNRVREQGYGPYAKYFVSNCVYSYLATLYPYTHTCQLIKAYIDLEHKYNQIMLQ